MAAPQAFRGPQFTCPDNPLPATSQKKRKRGIPQLGRLFGCKSMACLNRLGQDIEIKVPPPGRPAFDTRDNLLI